MFGGLGVGEQRRVKLLLGQEQRKHLVTDPSLDTHILQDELSKMLRRPDGGATRPRATVPANGAVAQRSTTRAVLTRRRGGRRRSTMLPPRPPQ